MREEHHLKKERSAEIDAKILAYCQKQQYQITVHRVSIAVYSDGSWQSAARYRLEKLVKKGVLKKIFNGAGTDPAISESRPLRRDSLCPAGATLVSTMPAPSGDSGGATR